MSLESVFNVEGFQEMSLRDLRLALIRLIKHVITCYEDVGSPVTGSGCILLGGSQ